MRAIDLIEQAKQMFLFSRDEESKAKKKKDEAKKTLKDYVAENGEPDEDGHIRWEFEPVTINGKTYKGLVNQRRKSTYINEDKALELARNLGVLEELVEYVPEYDWDKLYVLNQQGKISDDELDSVIETDVTYALNVIE